MNTELRNQFNDIYLYYYEKRFKYYEGEYQMQQDYWLVAFVGSIQLPDGESKKYRSGFMQEPTEATPEDITLVSQTSFISSPFIIYRIERLFYIPILLQRWKG